MASGPRPIREVLDGRRLPALDGLRAVAAITVIASHANVIPEPLHREWITGPMGVSGFFVLSGFLITWLLLREIRTSGRISLRDFYLRRTLRIWPAYYTFLLAMMAAQRWSLIKAVASLHAARLAAGFFVYDYYVAVTGVRGTNLTNLWTVSVEEQFYLLWPVVLLLLLRRGDTRYAFRTTLAVVIGVLLWRSFLVLTLGAGGMYVYHAFDTRFDNLAIGCLLALWTSQPGFEGFARAVASSPLYPVATLELLAFTNQTGGLFMETFGWTIQALLLALLILQLLQLSGSRFWSWLEHPVARYLGAISYPLYLYQDLGLAFGHAIHAASPYLAFAAALAGTTVLASLSYHIVERPFLRLKGRFAGPASVAVRGPGGAVPAT